MRRIKLPSTDALLADIRGAATAFVFEIALVAFLAVCALAVAALVLAVA